jgi:hypothetical protein
MRGRAGASRRWWFVFCIFTPEKPHHERESVMKEVATRIAGTILALAFLVVLVMSAEPTAAKAPTAPPQDINQSYAQRATWFIDHTLEGQYAAALQVGSDRFKRDIGEKGLRHFRDSMVKYGKGRFVPTAAGAEEGFFIVAGLLEFPGGRKMEVHVVFKGDKVEHLYQRWA